jgi:hypothetical protein
MSTQAASNVEALLQHAYRWTRAAAAVSPLAAQQAAPTLTVAAQLYEAEQYPAATEQLSRAVALVAQARQAHPGLPAL